MTDDIREHGSGDERPGIDERRAAAAAGIGGPASALLTLAIGPRSRFVRRHAGRSSALLLPLALLAAIAGAIPDYGWVCAAAIAPIMVTLWLATIVQGWRGARGGFPSRAYSANPGGHRRGGSGHRLQQQSSRTTT